MRDRLASETGEEREARLQQMRNRLESETGEENLRLVKRGRPGFSR